MTENERAARQKKISHAIMWIVLLILFICFIAPFILVIINVFKTKADITSNPLALIGAHGFTFKNFPKAMDKMNFWRVFGNSLIITVSATILTIIVSSMQAYVIVRNGRWKLCTLIFSLMIASMVIPFQVLMVPLVSVYGGTLGVLNHRITLILMHVGFSVSMAMFMFHGAIKTNIPLELEEAATIDGCSKWQTYWKVVFPLLKPTIATVVTPSFLRRSRLRSRRPSSALSRSFKAWMRRRMCRRSLSNLLSPGPRVPMPPPSRENSVPRPERFDRA